MLLGRGSACLHTSDSLCTKHSPSCQGQTRLQVICAAQQRLLIVSFSIYKAEVIMTALAAALQRGVRLRN